MFVTDIASGETRDLTPGDFDSPPFFYEDGGLAFSPDGAQLAFVSNREGNDVESWTTNQDVWLVPVAGGRRKTADGEQGRGRAAGVARRTASRSSCAAQRRPNFESDRWYLDVIDVASGQRRTIFESPDLSVEDYTIVPGGRLDRLHRAGSRRRQHLRGGIAGRHADASSAAAAPSPG